MTRSGKIPALALAALVLALVVVVASRTAEPRYQGRTLSNCFTMRMSSQHAKEFTRSL